MFPLPAATPCQTKLLGRSGCMGMIKASGLGWQCSALFACLHIHGTVNPRRFNNTEFCICYIFKYHLRNLSFLGYSQCLFLGQRRPTHRVTMPYYLFSFSFPGDSIPAVAASLY